MVSEKNLIKKDLNLLLALVVLYKERNTERTAERLFVTQSAISKALKKLRDQFNNPLFVRNRNGFVPTPFCEEVVAEVEPLLFAIEQIYNTTGSDSEKEYSGELSIAMSVSFGYGLAEKLYASLREDFPNAIINITTWSDCTEKNLLDGKIQLGINYSSIRISKDVKSKDIKPLNFKFVVRRDHALLNQSVSFKDMSQYPLVTPIIPNYQHKVSKIEQVFNKLGLPANVILRSDNAALCLACIKDSDAILPVNNFTANTLSGEYSVLEIDFDPNEYAPAEFATIYYSDKFLTTECRRLVESSIKKCLSVSD